jgi:hypothetical protein
MGGGTVERIRGRQGRHGAGRPAAAGEFESRSNMLCNKRLGLQAEHARAPHSAAEAATIS